MSVQPAETPEQRSQKLLDEHSVKLGRLIGNLQSLEFLLRAYLQEQPGSRPIGLPYGTDVYTYSPGSEVPESELTSYDALGRLIEKYNADAQVKASAAQLDPALVEIRDALAHGRVSTVDITKPLRIIKFSRPKGGKVRVEYNAEMSGDWFQAQTERAREAMMRVHPLLRKPATP